MKKKRSFGRIAFSIPSLTHFEILFPIQFDFKKVDLSNSGIQKHVKKAQHLMGKIFWVDPFASIGRIKITKYCILYPLLPKKHFMV